MGMWLSVYLAWEGPGNLRGWTFPLSGSSSVRSPLYVWPEDGGVDVLWEFWAAGLKLQVCESMLKPKLASQDSKVHAEEQVSPGCNTSQAGTGTARGTSA